MEIEDVIPVNPEFSLASTGKTYALRPPNLHDQVIWKQKYDGGQEKVAEFMRTSNWQEICAIAYQLMTDKSDFVARREKTFDENGVPRERVIGGGPLLLEMMGPTQEGLQLMGAISRAFAMSQPKIDKAMQAELEKKSEESPSNSTGVSSSSSLQPNTDTPQSSSGN